MKSFKSRAINLDKQPWEKDKFQDESSDLRLNQKPVDNSELTTNIEKASPIQTLVFVKNSSVGFKQASLTEYVIGTTLTKAEITSAEPTVSQTLDSVIHSTQLNNIRCGCSACALPLANLNQLQNQQQTLAASTTSLTTIPANLDLSQTFFLSSLPGANHTIYLDFDGHITSGTAWNTNFTGGANIVTPAFDFDGNTSSFSSAELERIQYIWQRVAEDFIPFNVNVTTQAPTDINDLIKSGSGDTRWGIRVVIGGNSSWLGSTSGGIAYINSFNWSSDTPTFVFSSNLGNGEKSTAEAISHEVGHALGLKHDGRISPPEEYYKGAGSGETGWASIMGISYYQNLTQWSRGQYASANNTEDDLQIITTNNGFSYRADDAGNTIATAKPLTNSTTAITGSGIIERNTDIDYYSFVASAGSITITVNPVSRGPNLDIWAGLYNSAGTLLAASNPADLLSASITITVAAGTYYLAIDGVGKGDPLSAGYTDYGSLGQYYIQIATNDVLYGSATNTTLAGGLGDDTYVVDSTAYTIIENPGEGTDTIISSVTFSLADLPNVENLTLTGTASINGTGNAANNIITGNSGNNILNGGAGVDTLIGGLGNDTYIVDSTTDTIIEKPGEGIDTIQSSVTFSLAALPNVENLTLTGTASINGTGNAANNIITGNSGNNTLNGGGGVDTLIGGLGNDTYIVDSTTDTIIENPGEGTDTIQSSVTFSLAALANIENLTLTGTASINGTGNAANNTINGNSGNNILDGGAGNDTLNGGAGVDTLIGGLGNDTYIVDSTTDTIIENPGEGIDTIQSSVTFSLAALANIENLTLTGTASINGTGNAANNTINGNSGNNILNGGAGNDTLNGGAGVDTLIGGLGNDTYIVDSTTDTIIENPGEGIDTILSSVTFSLAALANIENLTLTGIASINGTGNAADNVITGNSGNNILNGGAGNDTLNGGDGVDTLIGGLGNDTYIVDSTTDTIIENPGEGIDTIQSSVTFSLAALPNIENLTLTGTASINGTGNAADNVINGNSGNNILNGGAGNDTLNGGAGVDTLIGGLGNDTYIVDSTTDTIIENPGEGIDTILSSVTFSLAALPNVENLTLTGTASINGTGNAANNVITGNSGNNNLNGGAGNDLLTGGGGKDTLTGGLGSDRFDYRNLADSLFGNFDIITDFNANAGNDLFLVSTARAGFFNAGSVASLTASEITAKLTTSNFAANFAAQFTFGNRTFVALNDATAGFSATTDSIIEVTGLTGTLGINNFTTSLV